MSERHLPDDQSSTIDPYLITSVRQTLAEQSAALQNLSKQLDSGQYQRVLNLIMNCKGHVILSGMGKSGHVGRKISATLASTGTPSFFIHPAEAFHGDLGMITPYDLLILISASGETDEILKLVPSLKNFGNRIIAITNNGNSTLAKNADAVLELHMANETCPNNLAPTTSTTLTMAIGDALAIAMIHQRKFMPNDFARYHPGGSAGAVPRQVIRFLNDEHNRALLRGVIASGNRNFGEAYGRAGDVIARKCSVPWLYRFELMGTQSDIENVRKGVTEFWQRQPQNA